MERDIGMWQLIRHSLFMRRTQSIATVITITVSVTVLFSLILTYSGVSDGLKTSRERLGADLLVVPADAAGDLDENSLLFTGAPANMYMSTDYVQKVVAVEGVARVTPQFYGQTLDASCCSASEPARLIGYDAATDWVIQPWTDSVLGRRLEALEVVVGSAICKDYANGEGTVLGRAVTMVAALDPTGTDMDGSILMDIDQVRDFVRDTPELSSLWEEYGDPSDLVSVILVDVDDGQRDSVIAALSGMEGVAVVESSSVISSVEAQMDVVFLIMAVTGLLLVAVSLLQLFARFYTMAWDRKSELALYRALGGSRSFIVRLIVAEALVLVGCGVATGIVLGVVLYLAIPSFLATAGSFPYVTPGVTVWLESVLGIVILYALIGFLAVLVPLRRSTRIDPSTAMQTGDID